MYTTFEYDYDLPQTYGQVYSLDDENWHVEVRSMYWRGKK